MLGSKIKLLAIGVIFMFSMNAQAETVYKPTQAHQALTQETKWLNVSRALKPEDLAGRIILVDFWTYCCINCMHIIPELSAIEEKFGDKIAVIGVHSAKFANEKDSENIREAVLRYKIKHPVVNDGSFKIWQSFAIHAWPTLVLVDQAGKIRQVYSGEGNKDKIISDVNALIEKGNYRSDKLPIALEASKQPKTILEFPSKLELGEYQGQKVLFIDNSGKNEIAAVDKSGKILARFTGDFNKPEGLLYANGKLYVADTGNHKLKVIDLTTSKTTTLAGNGERGNYSPPAGDPLKTALSSPWDLAFYPDQNHIAIANAGTHQIWSYDLAANKLSILAGNGRESIDDGKYPENSLSQTSGLSVLDDKLYFVDSETSSLRVLQNGSIKTLIGTGLFDFGYKEGKQGQALLQHPLGVLAENDKIYIADSYNHAIRIYNLKTGEIKNFIGNGKRGELNEPNDIIDWDGELYIADTNNNDILKYADSKLAKFAVSESDAQQAGPEKADDLPNLIQTKLATISGKKTELSIHLQPGWHINADAPSGLKLFSGSKVVQEFDKASLSKLSLQLNALEAGNYLLQGTVYYCEDKAGSECLIGSVNQQILVDSKSAQNKIELSFK